MQVKTDNDLGLTPVTIGSAAPSCANCPSALSRSRVTGALGKDIGGPACLTKGTPITLPIAQQRVRDRTAQHIAKSCDQYGKPMPEIAPNASSAPIEFGPVFLPNPNQNVRTEDAGRKVSNCLGCANYVKPTDVSDATGWNAGACLAKGTLLLSDRTGAYARNCDESAPIDRSQPGNLNGVFWFNEFKKAFGEVDHAALAKRSREIDPLDWPTDKPVTAAQSKRGIKAWRKVVDPEGGGRHTYLPIYHSGIFTPEEQELIPRAGDAEHPELFRDYGGYVYQLAAQWMEIDKATALWGRPGVGKTEIARHMAWLMGLPFIRISITGATEVDELAGMKEFDPEKGTYFRDGRLTKWWQRPCVIMVDEPNTGQNEVWQLFRPMFDNSSQLVLDMDGGRRVIKDPDCFPALSMNPAWDPRNVGTNTIGDADARRILHIYMDLPPEEIERDIIMAWCKTVDDYDPSPHLDNIMKVAADIRRMADEGSIPITWGIGPQVTVARLMRIYSPMRAYRATILDFLDPSVAEQVIDSIQSIYKN